ncbi:DUF6002 family protein [Pantoea agglomerans]|uniref:DUF6002 family protein n=1 Tax=Enterobacter agglomerans TaxID=549 RepID=UPI003209BEAB
MLTSTQAKHNLVSRNIINIQPFITYFTEIQELLLVEGTPDGELFNPGYLLPELDEKLAKYFSAAEIALSDLGNYQDVRLRFMDLRSNPATQTTKTFASLLMVARAVRYIHDTAEKIVIVTPSSANKATALRDAVWRAIDNGLVTSEQLRIVSVIPSESLNKTRESPLSQSAELAARNPIFTSTGENRMDVKELVRNFSSTLSQNEGHEGVNFWFTLSLDNYQFADAVRAFVEQDYLPTDTARLHAHSVSSAYGLLGHYFGYQWRVKRQKRDIQHPGYFLIQHLDTPDMVLDLYYDSFSRDNLPAYIKVDEHYRQNKSAHFPRITDDPHEVLETTFYTHQPVTSALMKSLIREHGGGGIVVSKRECSERHFLARQLLEDGSRVQLPLNFDAIRERSLSMAITGVINAIERKIIPAGSEVLVHASGVYSEGDYIPLNEESICIHPVKDVESFHHSIYAAAMA